MYKLRVFLIQRKYYAIDLMSISTNILLSPFSLKSKFYPDYHDFISNMII